LEELRELRPIRSRRLAAELIVLLPESLNLLLLSEDQRCDAACDATGNQAAVEGSAELKFAVSCPDP
jgi:hypothetical protein